MSDKMRLAVVYWDDAHASVEFADDEGLEESHAPDAVVSCGWVWRRDDEGITLVGCVGEDNYDRRLFVPTGMIRKIVYMRSQRR